MNARSWINKLFSPSARHAGRKSRRDNQRTGYARKPRLEELEDRLAPAITILDSGVGTLDGSLGPTDGTITAAESAGSRTLSRAALQGVGSTVNISITSDAISFNPLSSPLALQTGLGNS